MKKKDAEKIFANLPKAAGEYIRLVIKKMGYRRKVREDVAAELIAHFEDALASCKDDKEKEEKAQKLIAEFGDAKLIGILARRAKKRCRPLWRTAVVRFFQTIGILFLCLILYCIYLSMGKPNISVNYVERANELERPLADESLNAAPIYQKAFDIYVADPNIADKKLLDLINDKLEISELTPEELAGLKKRIADNNESLSHFRQASLKPYCWWKREAENNVMLNVQVEELQNIRNFARLLSWCAKFNSSQGRIDDAFDNVLTCYRTGVHYKGPRTIMEQLTGIAIQALACKTSTLILQEQQIDSQKLRNFQNDLEKLMASDTFTVSFEGEKLLFYDIIQRCFTDNGCGSGHLIPGSIKEWLGTVADSNVATYAAGLGLALITVDRGAVMEKFETAYGKWDQWAKTTPRQTHQAHFDFEKDLGLTEKSYFKRSRYMHYYYLMPAIEKIIELSYRNKIQCEAVPVVLAVLRYKQDKGDYPETLNQLVEVGYLKSVPMDPYSDKPLVYKRIDNDFTVYSIGTNFADDGGKVCYNDEGNPVIWPNVDQPGDAVFWPVPENKVKSEK